MKTKQTITLFLIVFFVSLGNAFSANAIEEISLNTQVPSGEEKIIVKKKNNFSLSTYTNGLIKNEKKLFPAASIADFSGLENVYLVEVEKNRVDEALNVIKTAKDVEYAEKDGYYLPQFVPDDPLYTKQWYFRKFFTMEKIWDENFSNSKN